MDPSPIFALLFVSGVITTTLAMLIGGQMFMSLPLFSVLFPELSYGQIVGNIKVGSVARGCGGIASLWESIHFRVFAVPVTALSLGTVLGINLIADADQQLLLFSVIIAIVLSEFAPRIGASELHGLRPVVYFVVGVYLGAIAVGGSVLLLAIIRFEYRRNSQIVSAKIQARFLETFSAVISCGAHYLHGNLIFWIWVPWVTGSVVGGWLGGRILSTINAMDGRKMESVSRWLLYALYAMALFPFLVRQLHIWILQRG